MARPRCESLEGRALLAAYSAYDSAFGRNGVVIGGIDYATGTELSNGTALAVAPDGKVVEAGTIADLANTERPSGKLAVRRYNMDGSLDTTFGTGGQANIPLPGSVGRLQDGPHNVVVAADGSIFLAATTFLPISPTLGAPDQIEGFVVKLTPAGQLDPTFGTGGEYVFAGNTTSAAAVALDARGNVVVLGGDNDLSGVRPGGIQSPTRNQLVVSRLTPVGVPDPTFNGTGSLHIQLPAAQLGAGTFDNFYSHFFNYAAATLAIDSGGLIYVAGNNTNYSYDFHSKTAYANLVRVNDNGTLDTTFGTGGTTAVGAYLKTPDPFYSTSINAMAFDAAGNLVVVGSTEFQAGPQSFINRLLPAGTLDTTFAGNSTATFTTAAAQTLSYNSVAIGTDGAITIGASGLYGGSGGVVRYTPAGALDANFGIRGLYRVNPSPPVAPGQAPDRTSSNINAVALTANGNFVVAGDLSSYGSRYSTPRYNLVAQLQPVRVTQLIGDYDGDGVGDIAAYLPGSALYAYRPTNGSTDALLHFGAGAASVPAPGDYNGDGRTDLAVYVPDQGKLYYQPSTFAFTDGVITIGGAGDIPAPGDYDGDGRTEAAVYDPTTGSFLIRDSSTASISTLQFGAAGVGASIPAPGDYDGDGKTDLAVYLPSLGVLAYRPSSGGLDVLTSFGLPGDRMSIPAPGDYDGDGVTDLAVYLPSLGVYAYRPSAANPVGDDVLRSFGLVGDGATIPAPGDYDGDGVFDLAVYIPQYALYAYRPSSAVVASSDVWTTFGDVGPGVTIPAASIPYAQPAPVSRMSLAASPEAGVPLALTDDVLELLAGTTGRKKKA